MTDFWPKTEAEQAEMDRRIETCLHLWQRAHLFGYPANYRYCALCGATDRPASPHPGDAEAGE